MTAEVTLSLWQPILFEKDVKYNELSQQKTTVIG